MRARLVPMLLPLLLLTTAAAPKAHPVRARWTLTYDLKIDTVNGAAPDTPEGKHKQETICSYALTEADLQRIVVGDARAGCAMDRFTMADGKIAFAAHCGGNAKHDAFTTEGTGHYTDAAAHLDVRAHGTGDGDVLEASGTATAIRGAAC